MLKLDHGQQGSRVRTKFHFHLECDWNFNFTFFFVGFFCCCFLVPFFIRLPLGEGDRLGQLLSNGTERPEGKRAGTRTEDIVGEVLHVRTAYL